MICLQSYKNYHEVRIFLYFIAGYLIFFNINLMIGLQLQTLKHQNKTDLTFNHYSNIFPTHTLLI